MVSVAAVTGAPTASFGEPDRALPLVVFCSAMSWDGVALSDRHLATQLSRFARILWVDPPVSPMTRSGQRHGLSRLPWPRLRQATSGIVRLTPSALPGLSRRGIRVTTAALSRKQVRWALDRLVPGVVPHAVISCSFDGLLGGWGPGVTNVMYGTDDYVAGARLMGLDVRAVIRAERRQIAAADLVVAVSTNLCARWSEMGAPTLLLPNGVLTDGHRSAAEVEPPDDVALPAPVAGVIGHLSERIDLSLLEGVVAGGCSLLLVGPLDRAWEAERFAALCRHDRVRWVGERPFGELPRYLRLIDVGLTPYVDSAFNRASFPLKTLEYLSAGIPVVSTDLPATRWLGTDLVRIATGQIDFTAAVQAAARESRQPELVAARQAFAARHSWADRAAELAVAIGLVTEGVRA